MCHTLKRYKRWKNVETQNKRDEIVRTMIRIMDVLNNDQLDLSEDIMALTWVLRDIFREMLSEAKDDKERSVIEKSRNLVVQVILGQI